MGFNLIDDKAVLIELAARLRRARLGSNLTQQEVARQTGLSLKTVSNAEDGRNVSLLTFVALLRALGRLGDLDAVLGDVQPSPVDLAKRQGRVRERASGARGTSADSEEWEW